MDIDPYNCHYIVQQKGKTYQCKNKKKFGELCGLHKKMITNKGDDINHLIKLGCIITFKKLDYQHELNTKNSQTVEEIKNKILEYKSKKTYS